MPVRRQITFLFIVLAPFCLNACAPDDAANSETRLGVKWVRHAAEFEALCLQAYRAAGDFLGPAIADSSWSALPHQSDAGELPTAIIFDVDETVVSNVEFQIQLEPPFRNSKLDDWAGTYIAKPVPGAIEFATKARDAGVELFFVTNRPCARKPGIDSPCPQQDTTIRDLTEAGIEVDADHVMLANERPEWGREKSVRRNHIAETHRVIMLIGDDLGDFIACTRRRALNPCVEGATVASRRDATYELAEYWGAGWFVLPNPMHGSWTTVE